MKARLAIVAVLIVVVAVVLFTVVSTKSVGDGVTTDNTVGTTPTVSQVVTTTTEAAVGPEVLADFYEAVTASGITTTTTAQAPINYGSGACGGDLPPCYVMMRESGGDITAQNPTSTASGKWQFLDSTWGGYGGYAKARYAPEWVQDERARQLWAGGRGCAHWDAC